VEICGQQFSEEIIERIRETIGENPTISRRQLSLLVCEWLNWRNGCGKLKEMSGRVALLKLHRKGFIKLPEVKNRPLFGLRRSKRGDIEVGEVACELSELGAIEIVKIGSAREKISGVWNALMDGYHYLGSGPLCGAQMRYLIHSERHGWVGGLAFSSAAWRLEARDLWIGWDEQARRKHLSRVVCNSRFLIVPSVRVKNLASHALSLCLKRLVADWQERYGVEPVLVETFVDRDRYGGICYRASNWLHIGTTKGRGRQDGGNRCGVSIKDIYVYELRSDAREILRDGRSPCSAEEDRAPSDWAEEEFGGAELGDRRRVRRLLTLARDFYARPQAAIPQACGSRAKTKAAYRFFDEEENKMEKILASHIQSTYKRCGEEKVVLAVQDTTYLNYNTHPATENLGPIGALKDGCLGLIVHDTLAFNLDGTPLGLLDVQCWARDSEQFGKRNYCQKLPIEQKESFKWLKGFEAIRKAQAQVPNTVFVSVGDREADIYELFQLALSDATAPKLLIRAEYDRCLSEAQGYLWEHVGRQTVSGIKEIHIPRRKNRPARRAKLAIRFAQVTLNPPRQKRHLKKLALWAILAEEIDYAAEIEPLKWLLITTLPVQSFEEAVEKLDWYTVRYWIEVYHRTLKSGCKIEQRQLGKARRIETCLAIDMVVAWRIFYLTKLGRETPEVPCTVFFEEAEWKALVAYKTQNPIPPDKPPSLREAMHMVASLGGFLGRKCDGEPGTKTLWLGLQRLEDLTAMWKTCIAILAPHLIRAP